MSFNTPRLHDDLLRGIADLGFDRPTPIQRDAIPPALEGRDLLACAQTGSGKTAAFLLPILQRLLNKKRGTTRALVLSPTRELAAQTVEHFHDLARHTSLKAAAVFGGVGMQPQEKAFRQGVDVVVACPGRLLDHFQYPYAKLRGLEVLVLDEADRMLDMGFLPDIRRVLKHLPEVSQTLLFSATMPAPIVQLSRELLHNPVKLNIERRSAPAEGIQQAIYPVRQDLKSKLLLAMFEQGLVSSALVFTRTKHRADRLAKFLNKHNVNSDRIHGNRSQPQRTKALAAFKDRKIDVLVATDIAARGIDVELLSHVINFDVPHMPEDYIHRVGRTARAGATGEALTFVSPEETNDLRGIERAVGERLEKRQLEGFDHQAEVQEGLEIPLGKRLEAMRARRRDERARAAAKKRRANPQGGRGETDSRQRRAKKRPAGQGENERGNSARGNSSRGNSSRGNSARGKSSHGDNSQGHGKPRGQRRAKPKNKGEGGGAQSGDAQGRPGGNRPRRRRRRRSA